MKYFLKEYRTKILTDRMEMEKALEHYKETDEWLFLPEGEIRAFGVSDIPLLTGEIRKEFGDDTIFDDCAKKCALHTPAASIHLLKHTFVAPDAYCKAIKIPYASVRIAARSAFYDKGK